MHHAITLELFYGSLRHISPLDGDAVILSVLRGEIERVVRNSHQHGFLRVEHTARLIHTETLRVGCFDSPSDATAAGVDEKDQIIAKLAWEERLYSSAPLTSGLQPSLGAAFYLFGLLTQI
ncbi:hypothetical protein DdX_16251 [Ditylenchus destructor]|uniref:Uncharacterized protein n=1 Tax=Ditylenchus destructor TaxID=166010 RepID=A0AAD4MR99_9BILA|nr:hypothetical protein DdX_16251 [Ditylenchus destructor]